MLGRCFVGALCIYKLQAIRRRCCGEAGGEGGMLRAWLRQAIVIQRLQRKRTAAVQPGLGEGQGGVGGLTLAPPFQSSMISFQLGINLSCFIFQTLTRSLK